VSEAPLHDHPRAASHLVGWVGYKGTSLIRRPCPPQTLGLYTVQGYLAHKKMDPTKTLRQGYV